MEYVNKVLFPLKKKHKRKGSVDSFFFDKSGKVSEHLIQGLRQITQNSQHGTVLTRMKRRHSRSHQVEVI